MSHKAARIEPAGPVRLELVLAICRHGLVVVDVSDLAEEAFQMRSWLGSRSRSRSAHAPGCWIRLLPLINRGCTPTFSATILALGGPPGPRAAHGLPYINALQLRVRPTATNSLTTSGCGPLGHTLPSVVQGHWRLGLPLNWAY